MYLTALFLAVLLSRIPFLDAGYGVNTDAWRVARVARAMASTHTYMASRLPGYPVQEIACAFLWRGGADWKYGPLVLNAASAFFGALAVVLFALLARALGCKDYLLAAASLAFCPLFYISSVTSKDYVWGLAFCLASMLFVLKARPVAAGIFLGLAIGCRITYGAMALPLCFLLVSVPGAQPARRRVLWFGLSAALAAAVVFSPVFLQYGRGFLTFYDNHDRPGWSLLLSRMTVELWGWPGVAGLLLALAGVLHHGWRPASRTSLVCPPFHPLAWAAVLVIYIVAFFRLPDQAGYLMPVIPFVFLLLARFAQRTTFQIFCVLATVGSFVAPGAIFQDHAERAATVQNVRNFLSFTSTLTGKNMIVVGSWEQLIAVMPPKKTAGDTHFAGIMTSEEVLDALKNHFTIYYLPLIREFNYRVNGIDLAKYGGKDLRALYDERTKAKN